MKQSDLFTIIIVATVGMIAAFLASNAILGNPDLEKVTFNRVEPISETIVQPDTELFNDKAINPTVEVEVGTCEDSNGNGILDPEEREACMKKGESVVTTDSETMVVPEG